MTKTRQYTARLQELGLQSLLARRRMFDVILLFKLNRQKHLHSPHILRLHSDHTDNTDRRKTRYQETFLTRAHREWNSLPALIQADPTVNAIRQVHRSAPKAL
eukprot:Selendium_serpulae@DN5269_c1_g2_i1.p1